MAQEDIASAKAQLEKLLSGNPCLKLLEPDGLTLNADGSVCLSILVQDKHTNVHKLVHGGVFATLLDTAMGYSCVLLKNSSVVTLNLATSFVANCKAGTRVNVTGQALYHGRRVVVAEGEARDERGTLLVSAQGSFFVIEKAP